MTTINNQKAFRNARIILIIMASLLTGGGWLFGSLIDILTAIAILIGALHLK